MNTHEMFRAVAHNDEWLVNLVLLAPSVPSPETIDDLMDTVAELEPEGNNA